MAYNSQYTGAQIDEAIGDVRRNKAEWSGKQDVILASGASVGDLIKVKAVDASGKPTAWAVAVAGKTQTVAQIVAAQAAGFAPICKAVLSEFKGLPATLPALLISSMLCVFGGIGSTGGDTFYLTVIIDSAGNLTAKTDDVATLDDIPNIPSVTPADNGKILRVVDGVWTAAELLSAGGVSF